MTWVVGAIRQLDATTDLLAAEGKDLNWETAMHVNWPDVPDDRLLSLAEIQRIMEVPRSTFFKKVRPSLPVIFLSASRRAVRAGDLKRWIASRREGGDAA